MKSIDMSKADRTRGNTEEELFKLWDSLNFYSEMITRKDVPNDDVLIFKLGLKNHILPRLDILLNKWDEVWNKFNFKPRSPSFLDREKHKFDKLKSEVDRVRKLIEAGD